MFILSRISKYQISYISLIVLSSLIILQGFNYYDQKTELLSQIESLLSDEKYDEIISLSKESNFTKQFKNLSCSQQGKINYLVGKAHYVLNNEKTAIDYFKKAVHENWNKCSKVNQEDLGNALFNIAISYQYTDEILSGIAYMDSAMYCISNNPLYPTSKLAYRYQGAGSFYSATNDFFRAENQYLSALQLRDSIEAIDVFYIQIELFSHYLKNNKLGKAEALKVELESNFNSISEMSIEDKALYSLNISEYYLRSNDLNNAIKDAKLALKILPKEQLLFRSNAFEILGEISLRNKDYQSSQLYYQQAYDLRIKDNNIIDAIRAKTFALENLAESLMHQNKMKEALDKINEAIALQSAGLTIDKDSNPILKNQVIFNAFNLQRILSTKLQIIGITQYNQIENIFYKIDTLINLAIKTAHLDHSKIDLLQVIQENNEKAIDYFVNRFNTTKIDSFLAKAFYFSSQSKALVLKQILGNKTNYSAEENSQYQSLKRELVNIQNKIIEFPEKKDSLLHMYNLAQNKLSLFNNKKNKTIRLTQPTLAEIINKLKSDEAILDYFEGNKLIYIFYVHNGKLSHITSSKDKLNETIYTFKSNISKSSIPFDKNLAYTLYNSILPSEIRSNENIKRLIIVPSGSINGLSFEALVNEKDKYLVEDKAIQYLFMLNYKSNINLERDFKLDLTGFATNYTSELQTDLINKKFLSKELNISKLNDSKLEIEKITNQFYSKSFFEKEASKENFIQNSSSSKILYLSLHGIVEPQNGDHSSLIFDNRNHDFVLRAYELNQLDLSDQLILLSTCHSADGKLHEGEGVNGLTRAFLASGARTVVSSFWAASERTSLNILHSFLNLIQKGEDLSTALQKAKIEYFKTAPPQQQHPFYWANFVVIGDSNAVHFSNKLSIKSMLLISLGFSILLCFSYVLLKKKALL